MTEKYTNHEPFWMDEPNPYYHPKSNSATKRDVSWWFSKAIIAYTIFFVLLWFGLLIIFAINVPVLWIVVVLLAIAVLLPLFLRRIGKTKLANVTRIQQQAREKTRSDYLGSAIHIAGHPLLQVNQPVVLGLKEFELSIYSYDSSTPIDIIPVNSIIDVSPVVYDDEYIPHVGVIDNTAQALQISVKRNNFDFVCSFRRMYKMRPIEWYHSIQKTRITEKAISIGKQ